MQESILCDICKKPLDLKAPDTCSNDRGRPVHTNCYMASMTQDIRRIGEKLKELDKPEPHAS